MLWRTTSPAFALPEWMVFPAHAVDRWWLAIVSRTPSPDDFQAVGGHLHAIWESLGFRPIDQAFSHRSHVLILPLQPALARQTTLADLLSPALWEHLRPVLCPASTPVEQGNPALELLPGFTIDIRHPEVLQVHSGKDVQSFPAWWRKLLPPELTVAPSIEARSIFEAARWMGIQRLNIIGASPPLAMPPPGLVYLTESGSPAEASVLSGSISSDTVHTLPSGQVPARGAGTTVRSGGDCEGGGQWEPHGWLVSPFTIPRHLRDIPQWVVWGVSRQENRSKPAKIPIQPRTFAWDTELQSWRPRLFRGPGWSGTPGPSPSLRMFCARSNQETTWGTFAEALDFLSSHPEAVIRRATDEVREDGRPVYVSETVPLRGLQFALHPRNRLVGIDIDHCIVDGRIAPEIQDIVQSLPGYWEYSPSLTGLRGFFLRPEGLEIPSSREFSGIEIYDGRSPRFLTVTGQHLGTPEVGPLSLDGWNWAMRQIRQHFARSSRAMVVVPAVDRGEAPAFQGSPESNGLSPSNLRGQSVAARNPDLRLVVLSSVRHPLSDEELLEYISHSPRHGARFQFYFRLWDIAPPEAFPPGLEPHPSWIRGDRSSGDSQMIFILTSYTQDPLQIDRIFRASPRMRPKWDRLIRQGGETYAEYVIGYNLGLRGVSLPFGFLESARHGSRGENMVSGMTSDNMTAAGQGSPSSSVPHLPGPRPGH